MSVKQVEFHQGADSDVRVAMHWYGERSRRAMLDFLEELDRAVEAIAKAPQRWPLGMNNTRRFLMWRFPFSIVYSERESTIVVWAVAHGSRLPEYWAPRM